MDTVKIDIELPSCGYYSKEELTDLIYSYALSLVMPTTVSDMSVEDELKELNRRAAEIENDPSVRIPHEEVYDRVMSRLEANKMEPFEPTHPGEVIKDEIEYRGISQRALAAQIGVSYTQLNEVLNGKRSLNTELALLISAALDIDAEPLLSLQTRYDVITARRNSAFLNRLKSIRKIAAAF